ncbi:MAG: response regulator transcription factor [Acidobacteriota bacterium]|nr:response regulator transcription factor [Acidobacteriota bacterium]
MSAVAVMPAPARQPAAEEMVWRLDTFNKFLLSLCPVQELSSGLGERACETLGFTRMLFLHGDSSWQRAWALTGCGFGSASLAAISEPFAASSWIARSARDRIPVFTASARMSDVLPVAHIEELGICALLCVPICDSGGSRAAMLFDRCEEPFAVDDVMLDVALAVGESIGRALEAASAARAPAADPAGEAELTPRQLEMLRMMARGLSNREIAGLTGLSGFTVRDHISALLHRLDVTNRSAAVMRGWQLGLLRRDAAPG